MKAYHQALKDILANGTTREDRTGVGTKGIFGYQMRFDLREGFPAITTKKLAWKAVVSELQWFLNGDTDERALAQRLHGTRHPDKKTIWTANADDQGKKLGYENNDQIKQLGPVYGKQWRDFGGVDQIGKLLTGLKKDPYSRRHIINAWNVGELDYMALPPCHLLAQFYVNNDNELSCLMYQRSADLFLGVPFNIASYSLLTHIIAELVGLKVGEFVHSIGDAHIYLNHIEQVKTQLEREEYALPTLKMPKFTCLKEVIDAPLASFELSNYKYHPTITAPMAV